MILRKRVLVVATDLSTVGDDAIVEGLTELALGSARALHVANILPYGNFIDDHDKPALVQEEEALANGPKQLHHRVRELAAVSGLPLDHARVFTHVRLGRPVDTLVQLCVDYDADMLIVGSHRRQGLERLVIGSVAEELVRKAPCPVLVARPTSYEGLVKTTLPDAPYAPGAEPRRRSERPSYEPTPSTTLQSWEPGGSAPTGFRIV